MSQDVDSVERVPLVLPVPGHDGGEASSIDTKAMMCLLLQHVSNTLNTAMYEFAAFLFLIEVYRDTLVPASLVGLFAKLSGLVFSGYIGSLVDATPRLRLVRWAIGAEKVLNGCNYVLFAVLFGPLRPVASDAFHGRAPWPQVCVTWAIVLLTACFSSVTVLANTGLTVAVERDWVTTIAGGNKENLTILNTWMRRIDLFSKLVAPLSVSLMTTLAGYSAATWALLALAGGSLVTELWWVEVVFDRFPVLRETDHGIGIEEYEAENHEEVQATKKTWGQWLKGEAADWAEFTRLPIFASSLAVASIYLTTLSYDGTFIAYIKAVRGWDDAFIAAMRGLCILTGMLGTVVMPRLEKRIGLERAGAWSIWFEIGCLLPVILSVFYGTGSAGEHGPAWNSVILFGGIALSRIGLWSFDLCQLALQNLFDLLKYVVTLAASSPLEFKWTALVSFIALVSGGMSYAVYLKMVRGHLLHLDWCRKAL